MIKRWIKWLVVLAALLLAACGGTQTAVPTATAGAVDAAEAGETAVVVAHPGREELTAITHTGRPQFLNAFASW